MKFARKSVCAFVGSDDVGDRVAAARPQITYTAAETDRLVAELRAEAAAEVATHLPRRFAAPPLTPAERVAAALAR